ISGWTNVIFKNDNIEKMYHERAKLCSECIHSKKKFLLTFIGDYIDKVEHNVCDICSCPLISLLRTEDEKCPNKYW
ncbi:MAG: hypothetical protein ACC656_08565, partial [Candidatus Heimdallarchaeota archaeon]